MYDEALLRLEKEVERYAKASPGSSDWLVRQATSLGLSFLRQAQSQRLSTPEDVDALRKQSRVIQDA